MRWQSRLTTVLTAPVMGAVLLTAPGTGFAVQAEQSQVVSAVPSADTPDVNDGTVFAITSVGSTMVIGGSFTSISPHGQTTSYPLAKAAAFAASTGAPAAGFKPDINGSVHAVLAGPAKGTVYVAGSFTQIDGVTARVALLDLSDGSIVNGWTAPAIDGDVKSLALSHGLLFVGGDYDSVGGAPHAGLVALDPSTGQVSNYVSLGFTGHHNYDGDPAHATAGTGVTAVDVNPAGNRMVVIGNFTEVSGVPRDQIALLDLGSTSAALDANWATQAFTAPCFVSHFDSYVRGVQWSPDGGYFVVVATGGLGHNDDGTKGSCDSASRYNAGDTGDNVRPVWIDYTGEDSLYSVSVTGTAVYVGGHERWLNNDNGHDDARGGAVPRAGIAALDPMTGLPLFWNPGRHPRGDGTYALYSTASALYVGSDTEYIGYRTYLRKRIAAFPLSGGELPPSRILGSLPGKVYLAGGPSHTHTIRATSWKPGHLPSKPVTVKSFDTGRVHGAFEVGRNVYYGLSNGKFYERSFDGSRFGGAVVLNPYHDPVWKGRQTGSGQTYDGHFPSVATDLPTITSMFYLGGRLFYTMAGQSQLFWRWFSVDSGIVGQTRFTISDGVDWSHVAGAFYANGKVYFADSATHHLMAAPFSGAGIVGTPALADSHINWASRGMFLVVPSKSRPSAPSIGSVTVSGTTATVSFGRPSSSAGQEIRRYTVLAVDETSNRHGDQTALVVSSPGVVSGLHPGDTYHFVVTAAIKGGPGAASKASRSVTVAAQ